MTKAKVAIKGSVIQGFENECVTIDFTKLLPVKALNSNVRSSHKYQQIAASIREIGLVEPPVVARDDADPSRHLLLDGHLRVAILRDMGVMATECLIAKDDEAFTYNRHINRLSAVQEQHMIARAIERNVPREKLAKALNINGHTLKRKLALLDGICQEAVELLKDKICPMAVFDVLRRMVALRQIEAAELMINANNFTASYAAAILAGTPQVQLTDSKPKRMKGMTAEAIARMERELSRLQQSITSIQDSYGRDHLNLTIAKGYLSRLLKNERISGYLSKHQPEFFSEFQNIAEMTSTLPVGSGPG